MAKTLFATFIFFLRKIRIRFFEKVASRATKMLERALISQGKVKSALVARETCGLKVSTIKTSVLQNVFFKDESPGSQFVF